MSHLFIARQPIYDRYKGVTAYEVLYRSDEVNEAHFIDADQASCETIINSCMNIGMESLVGSAQAFINLPREFIVNKNLTPMFKQQIVLEVLEDIKPDDDVINGIKRLKEEGYLIALDDFIYRDELLPLVKLADYIKFDLKIMTKDEIKRQFNLLKSYPVKLLAEKVETPEMYQYCYDLGFDYFQGFFFCCPIMLKHKSLPSNKLVVLKILNKLQNPEVDTDELETILVQDITLAYKLLRYINCAAFAFRREIDSIKEAIVLLGTDNLKNWISLIMMSKIVENKPPELIITGMIRGKMCELVAERHNPEIKHQMFIIGLFSVLDALMDQPLIELLDTVTLSIPVRLALIDKEGIQGEIYQCVLEYEKCNWDELSESDIDPDEFIQSYLTAVHWADESIKSLLNN